MEAYLTKFQWEAARYPPRQSVPAIVDLISKVSVRYFITRLRENYLIYLQHATQIDGDLKLKSTRYNTLRSSLQQLERKAT